MTQLHADRGPMHALPEDLAERLEFAVEVARQAGRFSLEHFRRRGWQVETKGDGSFVTEIDRETERRLRRCCLERWPSDGFVGEETGSVESKSGMRWVVDPIDGTASFVHGVPLYGTLVALEREERSLAGVIHMPALGETVYAARGMGAWHVAGASGGPVAARVSKTDELRRSTLSTTAFDHLLTSAAGTDLLVRLRRSCGVLRGWTDCYAMLLVATGRIEVAFEPVVALWDVAPMTVIVEEAGGRFTDWEGVATAHAPTAVASNGLVHDAMLGVLRAG